MSDDPRISNLIASSGVLYRTMSVTNYMRGGQDNFAADRKLYESLLEAYPSYPGLDKAARRFHDDQVTARSKDRFTRFVDLGCGFPHAANPTHGTAKAATSGGVRHTLYIDYDPYALSHLDALWPHTSHTTVLADISDTAWLRDALSTAQPRDYLTKRTAYFLTSVAQELDDEALAAILLTIADEAATGSYVVLTQMDDDPELHGAVSLWGASYHPSLHLRSPKALAELLPTNRYELIPPPGSDDPISPVTAWLPIKDVPPVPVLGLVARVKRRR